MAHQNNKKYTNLIYKSIIIHDQAFKKEYDTRCPVRNKKFLKGSWSEQSEVLEVV